MGTQKEFPSRSSSAKVASVRISNQTSSQRRFASSQTSWACILDQHIQITDLGLEQGKSNWQKGCQEAYKAAGLGKATPTRELSTFFVFGWLQPFLSLQSLYMAGCSHCLITLAEDCRSSIFCLPFDEGCLHGPSDSTSGLT